MTSHRSLASSWLHQFTFSHMLVEAHGHATPQKLTLLAARLITHPQLTACVVDGPHCCSNAARTAHSHAFDTVMVYLLPDAWSICRSRPHMTLSQSCRCQAASLRHPPASWRPHCPTRSRTAQSSDLRAAAGSSGRSGTSPASSAQPVPDPVPSHQVSLQYAG